MDVIISAVVAALKRLVKEIVDETWLNAAYSFNPGQTSLFHRNLLPAVDSWKGNLDDVWPYTDSDEYQAFMYSCYDMEVIERAFSNTIELPCPDIDELAFLAEMIQEFGEELDFDLDVM